MDSTSTIRQEAHVFYEKLFNQKDYWNVFPSIPVKKLLSPDAAKWLERPVTTAEIKRAIFQMGLNKDPGPDSYNAHFFQHNWELIGPLVIQSIHPFLSGRLLRNGTTHSYALYRRLRMSEA